MSLRQLARMIPEGIHKEIEILHLFPLTALLSPLLPVISLFFSGLVRRICVQTPQSQPKPKLHNLLSSYPSGFFYVFGVFVCLFFGLFCVCVGGVFLDVVIWFGGFLRFQGFKLLPVLSM